MKKYDFFCAIKYGEVEKYLRGDVPYRKYYKSDFYIAYEPTETSEVIKEVFASEIENGVSVFLDTLLKMMEESAVNTYLVFDYLISLIYENKNKNIDIKPYKKEIEELKIRLARCIMNFQDELKGEIIFPNGWNQINAWDDIQKRCDCELKRYLII